ncbi:MAG TPA: glycoside hydrolase family 97 catalytic domain-containing protein [Prolixibacteraceae bacterium]|jgi:hypothetical protein|nr:glycoside hydrolase family 97 catalytic domain-containing protein [Prolixibacteraceae bacterium]HRV87668.1 glycoside hydrolase family 97 catalytic domain-containing protein [Prolixibacteraceae bacterium]
MKRFLPFILLTLIVLPGFGRTLTTLRSPSGHLQVTLITDLEGKLFYTLTVPVRKNKTELVKLSSLGISRTDQKFTKLTFVKAGKTKTVDETYLLHLGKRKVNRNHYNEKILQFKNENGTSLELDVRMYDEGLAFRYQFPETGNEKYTVIGESTVFCLPKGLAWIQPYDTATAYAPAYERNYEGPVPIGSPSPGKEGWCFPALFQVNDHWLMISEANLRENFYASHLKLLSPEGTYRISPPETEEAFGRGSATATSTLPWEMPWRVVAVGRTPGEIGASNLIFHLSDPPAEENFDWVRPGRASWAWWSGYLDRSTDTPEKLKKFIDLAHTMGWEYSLVDAGWNSRKGLDLTEITRYAADRNVKLLMWYNSGGPINKVNAGPRDVMYFPEMRDKEMKRISDLGISGIKVDFFCSDKQEYIQLYHDILKDAARYKLLVNFHGATIPRGWQRTHPHLISVEAVKGEEAYIYHRDFEEKAPVHNAILPYTRNVTGSMDYTVGAFSTQQVPHKTTYGHELALTVAFESGIQHFADTPEMYQSLPAEVRDFLKEIPAAWDETIFLSGYPGRDVVIARRKGNIWYVGGINAENKEKTLDVDFSSIIAHEKGTQAIQDKAIRESRGGNKAINTPNPPETILVISDGLNNKKFSSEKRSLAQGETEKIKVLPYGGFVIKYISPPAG